MRTERRQGRAPWGALARVATILVLGACAEQTEPLPSPIVARPLGGDSLQSMVIVCKADDAGCVPTYAVACQVKWIGDLTQGDGAVIPALSPEEQAWCAAQPRRDSDSR
jgi:hypothetical protein